MLTITSCIYSLTTSQHTFTSHVSAKPRLKTRKAERCVLLCLLNITESKSHRDLVVIKMRSEFSHPSCFICKTRHNAMCKSVMSVLYLYYYQARDADLIYIFWGMMLYIRRNSGCYHTDTSIIENI